MGVGTELEIIPPPRSEIAGGDAQRLPTIHTTASNDLDLIAVWLKSHADGSPHTVRAYDRIGHRFVAALSRTGGDLQHATIDHVQVALEDMRVRSDGAPASAATVNMQVAAVKALLGFAHQVGYTRFNSGPLIKLKKAPRQLAQRILSEFDTQKILRAAKPGREELLCEVGYYGALRVSEIASLTWSQVIPRETGEVQLALVGKGDKPRHVLLPAETAKKLLALRSDAAESST